MTRTRQILAVVAVTTALCADQIVVAAPAPKPQVVEIGQIAGRLVKRLSESFRQEVPAAVRSELRQQMPAAVAQPVRVEARPAGTVHCTLCAFQFRLPPPTA